MNGQWKAPGSATQSHIVAIGAKEARGARAHAPCSQGQFCATESGQSPKALHPLF
jgi:hypothetical protein